MTIERSFKAVAPPFKLYRQRSVSDQANIDFFRRALVPADYGVCLQVWGVAATFRTWVGRVFRPYSRDVFDLGTVPSDEELSPLSQRFPHGEFCLWSPGSFPRFPPSPEVHHPHHRGIFHPAGSFWTIPTVEASAVLRVSTRQRTAVYLIAGMINIPLPTQWLRRTTFLRNRNNR